MLSRFLFISLHIFLALLFQQKLVSEGAENATSMEQSSLVNMTSGPLATVNGCVNAISGDYNYSNIDYVLSGPDAYMLGRSYVSSSEEYHNLASGWSFYHPETLQMYAPEGIFYGKDLSSLLPDETESEITESDEFEEDNEPEEIEEITNPQILAEMKQFEDSIIDGSIDDMPKEKRCGVLDDAENENIWTQVTLSEPGGSKLTFKGK